MVHQKIPTIVHVTMYLLRFQVYMVEPNLKWQVLRPPYSYRWGLNTVRFGSRVLGPFKYIAHMVIA